MRCRTPSVFSTLAKFCYCFGGMIIVRLESVAAVGGWLVPNRITRICGDGAVNAIVSDRVPISFVVIHLLFETSNTPMATLPLVISTS